MITTLPPTLDAKALSALLYKSESTILRDVSRNPGSLPPFFRSGKKPLWLLQVVLDWIAGKSSAPITVRIEFPTSQSKSPAVPAMRSLGDELMIAGGE